MKPFDKAIIVLEAARNDDNFHEDNADNIIATGDRSVDYVLYCIKLSDEYFMLIDFTDFSLDDFSIIHKKHEDEINRMFSELY